MTERIRSADKLPGTMPSSKRPRDSEKRLLLYCSCAGLSRNDAAELNGLLSGRLDWEFVSEEARSHNIRQLLYHNLNGLSNRGLIPSALMADLEKSYHETAARNMLFYAELRTILDAFRLAGLDVIVLKGAALAGIVYADIGLRPMVDIDLLVKEEELTVADRIMTDLDYSAAYDWQPEEWYTENHFHLPPYQHAKKPVIVEIHWHFTMNPCRMDIRKWWKRVISTDTMGYRIVVPSPEDMLIHLAVHSFDHSYENGFVLRCLCDMFETLRHYRAKIDWELFRDEVARQRIEKQVHSMLYLVKESWPVTDEPLVPIDLDHADHRFLHALRDSLFAGSGNAPTNPHILKSLILGNFSRKITFLLSKMFPSRREMAVRYPASPSSVTIFFYYLVRPFHLLAKYGRSAARTYWSGRGRNK